MPCPNGQFSSEPLWVNIGTFDCILDLTDETTEQTTLANKHARTRN
jgi:hypothetical protein